MIAAIKANNIRPLNLSALNSDEVEAVTRDLLGPDANDKMSVPGVSLRYGTHGSLSVDLEKGRWYDHEKGEGGGILKLVMREKSLNKAEAWKYICDLLGYDATTKWERVKGLEWFYEDADKNIVLRVERRENGEVDEDGKPKKQYWQSRPDDSGGWVYDVKRVEPVPYRLPDLNNALLLNIPIFLAEVEKCVDALLKLGVVATTNAGGAGFWSYKLNKYFKNAVVIFLPDNDEAGRARLKKVGEHLHGIARSLHIVDLNADIPLPKKGDIVEWIARGGTKERLLELAVNAPELDVFDEPEGNRSNRSIRFKDTKAALNYMNKHFAYVRKAGIVELLKDSESDNYYYDFLKMGEARELLFNFLVETENEEGEADSKKLFDVWFSSLERRQYTRGKVFHPSSLHLDLTLNDIKRLEANKALPYIYSPPEGTFNLWRGFGYTPSKGIWFKFQTHLLEVICRGDVDLYEYLLNWVARMLQQPHKPGDVAIVIRGSKGCGKGIALRAFKCLLGKHGMQVTNAEHITGKFNKHLSTCVCLYADEAFYAGDKKHESVLKALITEEELPIEGKGVDIYMGKNRTHVMISSNATWVVPASSDERRFCVTEALDTKLDDFKYFDAITEELENGGYEAMLCGQGWIDGIRGLRGLVTHCRDAQSLCVSNHQFVALAISGPWLFGPVVGVKGRPEGLPGSSRRTSRASPIGRLPPRKL